MKALIDADIVAFRCSAVAEKDDLNIAIWQANQLVERILRDVGADSHELFLSGSDNFRYNVYSEYKANRRDMVRPRHLEKVRENLLLEWSGRISYGNEADDEIGIAHMAGVDTIICSTDKDLDMLPGPHYNFVKLQHYDVSPLEADYNFWYQMLVGDAADNIKGCPGIGAAKAPLLLETNDMAGSVLAAYLHAEHKKKPAFESFQQAYNSFEMNGKVLWIWRVPNDMWSVPKELLHIDAS